MTVDFYFRLVIRVAKKRISRMKTWSTIDLQTSRFLYPVCCNGLFERESFFFFFQEGSSNFCSFLPRFRRQNKIRLPNRLISFAQRLARSSYGKVSEGRRKKACFGCKNCFTTLQTSAPSIEGYWMTPFFVSPFLFSFSLSRLTDFFYAENRKRSTSKCLSADLFFSFTSFRTILLTTLLLLSPPALHISSRVWFTGKQSV